MELSCYNNRSAFYSCVHWQFFLQDGKERRNRRFRTEGLEMWATTMKKVICTRHEISYRYGKKIMSDISWKSKTTIA